MDADKTDLTLGWIAPSNLKVPGELLRGHGLGGWNFEADLELRGLDCGGCVAGFEAGV
jgi:hypothetical protein